MLILGLQGSPRRKSNTHFLLSAFLSEARRLGARTHLAEVCRMDIQPCKELVVCEKKGTCPIKDDMTPVLYPLLREAEVVVAASPVFFYNVTAQLKAVIDRSQALWARKYRLKLRDPLDATRTGVMLAVGATRGKQLFDGLDLTAQYFFDAVAARFKERLMYREIEHPGDMAAHPTVYADIKAAVARIMAPLADRQKVLFAGDAHIDGSHMAAAFLQHLAGNRFDASCAGTRPAPAPSGQMAAVMAEKGIDMAFRRTRHIDEALAEDAPEVIIAVNRPCQEMSGSPASVETWGIPDALAATPELMRQYRDTIENRVRQFIADTSR
ncbi:MAG: NAD(P)H-dependent oxidoreductase [Pseudomonadota bacterium]